MYCSSALIDDASLRSGSPTFPLAGCESNRASSLPNMGCVNSIFPRDCGSARVRTDDRPYCLALVGNPTATATLVLLPCAVRFWHGVLFREGPAAQDARSLSSSPQSCKVSFSHISSNIYFTLATWYIFTIESSPTMLIHDAGCNHHLRLGNARRRPY